MDTYKNTQLIEEAKLQVMDIQGQISLKKRNNCPPGALQEYKREYIKVDQFSKQRLYRLVFQEGYKIYEAAQILGIKYPTAKTILFHYRKEQKLASARAQIAQKVNKLRIITTISNKVVSSRDYYIEVSPRKQEFVTIKKQQST